MADPRRLGDLPEASLEAALRELGGTLAVPFPTPVVDGLDLARRARLRIEAEGIRPTRGLLDRLGLRWGPTGTRPMRRGLVLALAALLVLAAIAGAIGFGLPGLRIVFGPTATPSPLPSPTALTAPSLSPSPSAPPTPSPSPGPPGSTLSLGRQVTLAEARTLATFPVAIPSDPKVGEPDTVWIDDAGRVTLVWVARPDLPSTDEAGIGLVLSEIPGTLEREYFEKILGPGVTVEPVEVGGRSGFWISGAPHDFLYVDPSGVPTYDNRRMVGDTLAWSTGTVTFRIESALGRDATIAIGETLK
jgi:hypothetical protein